MVATDHLKASPVSIFPIMHTQGTERHPPDGRIDDLFPPKVRRGQRDELDNSSCAKRDVSVVLNCSRIATSQETNLCSARRS